MKPRTRKLAPFVPLMKDTMKTPAWRALSHGAKMLYVSLKGRYNRNLGNAVYLSARVAAEELGSNKDSIVRWFHELQYYGFIVMVSPGSLGVEGRGKAPHYRLTEEWYLGQAPTRDYLKWDGEKFHQQKSPSHYTRKKQNPVPNSGDSVSPIVGTVTPLRVVSSQESVPNSGDIQHDQPVPNSRDITSLTTR